MEYLIWTMLALLSCLALYAILERILFHATYWKADDADLARFLAKLRGLGRVPGKENDFQLGWMQRVVVRHRGEIAEMLGSCQCERRSVERFDRVLQMLIEVPAAVGLLGSVLGMMAMGRGGDQVAEMIGVGMRATMIGMFIAIPSALFWFLTGGRTAQLLDQIDSAIEVLMHVLNEQARPRQVPRKENSHEFAKTQATPQDSVAIHRRPDPHPGKPAFESPGVQPACYEPAVSQAQYAGYTNGFDGAGCIQVVAQQRGPSDLERRGDQE
jgi:biopolymer transport protein ExbB/TolQ